FTTLALGANELLVDMLPLGERVERGVRAARRRDEVGGRLRDHRRLLLLFFLLLLVRRWHGRTASVCRRKRTGSDRLGWRVLRSHRHRTIGKVGGSVHRWRGPVWRRGRSREASGPWRSCDRPAWRRNRRGHLRNLLRSHRAVLEGKRKRAHVRLRWHRA